MTRAMTDHFHGPDNGFWDFVYPIVVLGLGIAATAAIYIQINTP